MRSRRCGSTRSTAPLVILAVPLAGGAVLLTLGLALNALEAWWRGEFRAWLATDAGYLTAYLGILAGFVDVRGFAVAGRRRARLLPRPRASSPPRQAPRSRPSRSSPSD